MTQRTEPPYECDERTMLESWLEYHRETLAMKCDGLTPEQLRARSVPPSQLSLLGLVRHMAEVENNWFRFWLGGDGPIARYDGDEDFAVDGADVDEAFDYWRAECANARQGLARFASLDDVGAGETVGAGGSGGGARGHQIEGEARPNGAPPPRR